MSTYCVVACMPGGGAQFVYACVIDYDIGYGRYLTWRGSGVHLLNINPATDSREDYGVTHPLGGLCIISRKPGRVQDGVIWAQ